ncbi:DUF927 domain-containing protein [Paraclostridium bifermentans]|uniref:DUF927 domain-containing protein n=1 Tax=Paraclostridium bifermentans TaxID=1490 RepID=UPI001C7E990D|nr:DUF927 domain-containing protein [Paraclostridium bifermentans]GIM33712.1 hypothetical protein PAGU1678_29810 [Paraclostridium bifermentans subsp. muricolitidis]
MTLKRLNPVVLKKNGKLITSEEDKREERYISRELKLPTEIVETEKSNTIQDVSKIEEKEEDSIRDLEESNQERNNNMIEIDPELNEHEEKLNEIEKIDDDLSICYKTKQIVYDGGKTANLLEIRTPEKNIDTNNVILPITTKYLDRYVEMRVPRDKAMSKREILKLSLHGANVTEENAKYHIRSIDYQERKIGKSNNTHSELGFAMHDDKEIFKLDRAINEDSKYVGVLDLKPKGNLEDYLKDIREHVAPYTNISLAFVLGVSSAVVAKLNQYCEDVNTVLSHFVTESSKGKSTATMLAISIWGNPKLGAGGLYNTWNSTENALATSLAGNYGVAYALDELSMSKIEDTTSLIYNLVGGKDKARLTKDIELRKSGTWVTTIISNGEASLLNRAKNNTGLDVRVLELEGIVWTEDAIHSDNVKALANKNYGVFGYSFAEKLIKYSIDKLKLLFEDEKRTFIEEVKEKGIVDNMVARTATKYAILTLTTRLINAGYKEHGINLDIEGIRSVLVDTEINSIQRRGIQKKASEWLIEYVEANASKFKCGKESNPNVDYWGSRKELPNGDLEIAVLKQRFEDVMKQGGFEDTVVVLDQFKKDGMLDYEEGRLTRKRKINAVSTPVYVVILKP